MPSAPSPTPSGGGDAHMRAAELLGRIMDVFDAVDSCSSEALDRAKGFLVGELLAGELMVREAVGTARAPHGASRRNAVLTAAVECVQAASGDPGAGRCPTRGDEFTDGGTSDADAAASAGRVLRSVHRVLDGLVTLHDREPPMRRPGVVDVLAHMLRGPEPRTWGADRRDFARCVLEWMRAPGR